MKVLVVLSALVAFAAAATVTPAELELLQAFDFDSLLANEGLRNMIFDCLLKKGDCSIYKEMAELSLRVMKNQCADCSPAQKTIYDNVLKVLHDKYEPFYNELLKTIAAERNNAISYHNH